MKNTTQGFTLIELLIVIAIIGILAAVLIPNLLGARQRAYDAAAQSCAKAIATGQEMNLTDHQTYVAGYTTLQGVEACDADKMTITVGTADSSSYQLSVAHKQGRRTFVVTQGGVH